MMAAGIKNGEIRLGPPSRSALCSRSIVLKPPIPDAMKTPVRVAHSGFTFSFASPMAKSVAAIASWMKTSIFLTSFLSTNWSGSKSLTSPAIRAENCDASNRVIGPIPLCPAQSASQFAPVPMPSGDTRPTPVTTTRLLNCPPLLLFAVGFDVFDRFLHARDLLGVLVRNLDPELFLEGHDQLHRVQRGRPQIVHER